MYGLFFDFETSGLPEWKIPSDDPIQPHIVQIGAELVDLDSQDVLDAVDVVIKPDGWTISEEMTAIHGISQEYALQHGIPEKEAVGSLLGLKKQAALRVAHNRTFDDRIVRIALKRFFDPLAPETDMLKPSDLWKEGDGFCTCHGSRKAVNIGKLPTLEEAYLALTGEVLEGAHNAVNDVRACRIIYFALKKLGYVS